MSTIDHRFRASIPTFLVALFVTALLLTCSQERDDTTRSDSPVPEARTEESPAPTGPPAVALSEADDVTPPFPIERVEADLSHCEGRLREPGYPIVRVVVDEEGRVREAEPLNPTGSCVQMAFVEAVKQWRFQPAMRNGQPTLVEFNVAMSANP